MSRNSNFGKNNFDRLEAAGLVATADDGVDNQKSKLNHRIASLAVLSSKLINIQAKANQLYTLPEQQRLKTLNLINAGFKKLTADKLPVGAKQPLVKCINELTSLREGVFTGAATDQNTLTLTACADAIKEINQLKAAAQARLEKMNVTSSDDADMEDWQRNAKKIIDNTAHEADNLTPLNNKPFVVVRVPVCPTGENISIEKLVRQGFKTDNLGNYPVMHKQIVIGINPGKLGVDIKNTAKKDASHDAIFARADQIRRGISKAKGEKLFFVSDNPRRHKTGVWFWVMTEKDLGHFAKCFPSGNVSVKQWGFAFNE